MKWFRTIQLNVVTVLLFFLLGIIAANGLLDYYSKTLLKRHEAVTSDANELKMGMQTLMRRLNASDLGFRGFYIIPNEKLLNPYLETLDSIPKDFQQVRSLVQRQGLNPNAIAPIEQSFSNYFKLVDQMVVWRKAGNLAAIDSVVASDPGYPVWFSCKTYSDTLESQLKQIVAESQEKTDLVMLLSTSFRFLLFLLGIPTIVLVVHRLSVEHIRRKKLFEDLEESKKKYLFDENNLDGQVDENKIISSLIRNLSKATAFISQISKNNFEISWEGMTIENKHLNQENLAGELIQMREQMLKVKQEDQRRMWATEGISQIAELVRRHQDNVQLLSDKITTHAVKYLQANQASLFFVEEVNQQVLLRLQSCYAYDKKKYLHKEIVPGEGLVGQTYLEKELTYLTSIPQNYISITSGLGQATPNSLVIVPLKFNEQVEGVLEIASFQPFQPFELDFLQKIGEIIASAIVTIRSSTAMNELMVTLQAKTEEMKAQEEEMRQNMEELMATQEEMSRKTREYQSLLAERDQQLQDLIQANN